MLNYESSSPVSQQSGARVPWLAVVKAFALKQIGAEVFGMPGYRFTLGGAAVDGFQAAPHEVRPASSQIGKAILSGRYAFAGARMSVQGSGDPWNRPSPNRGFALELHRFSWLMHLMTQGDAGAKEGLRLYMLWHKTFRTWTPFVWGQEILARRLINVSVFARKIATFASEEEAGVMAQSLVQQARHLLRLPRNLSWFAQKAVALVLVGCVLGGKAGDNLRKTGLRLLPKALKRTVLPDGCHASRNPEQGLNLLYDLLLLEDALSQRGLPLPEYLADYIEKLTRAVRTLTHPDGSLCAFQGSESLPAEQVTPALVHEDNRPNAQARVATFLEHGRYHRLNGRSLLVFADAGEPKSGLLGYGACDHPLTFEVSGGFDKLIIGPGWSPPQSERQEFRVAGAANTVTIGESAILNPISGKFAELLGFTLEGLRYRVRSRRVESDESGALLEMEHEGWRPKYGLKHERRLFVDPHKDELRGEDRLVPVEAKPDLPMAAPFTIRFLLHPDVQVSLSRDRKSVLLRGLSGRGWTLRHDAKEVTIEHGNLFEKGQLRKTSTVALRGVCRLDGPTRVRWKLAPAD
ncbi:heparinase II/III family protein [Asticcacaulis sp. SL142]|uniref:heparinase II/III family protein n=1 Tax=Asticcacaulis sp. SL142 TaxID=2995155 RepID=UPI00226C76D2|nr:heparinase II/III family protein [Asticcacaulis sp. SL142]WAC47351.1 heparinase II/III family protein [Asticcacaulis sp. SL142]